MEKSNEHLEELEKSSEISEEEESETMAYEEDQADKNARQLIEEARALVSQTDGDLKGCIGILDEDIALFEEKKEEILNGGMQEANRLLDKLGFESKATDEMEEEAAAFAAKEEIEPMHIYDLSTGRFSAFILSLIAGIAVVIAWIYAATEKLGMTLDVSKVPDEAVRNKLLSWIGGGITGGEGNPMMGLAILIISALLLMWAVYQMKVYLQGKKNIKIAEEVNEKAKFYCTKKEECKREMEMIGEHIHEVVDTLAAYDIFLDEKNATLRRIIYLEGTNPDDDYHPKSKEDMKQEKMLVDSLSELITTPMADMSGSVSDEAKRVLDKSHRVLRLFKERLYE